MANYTIEGPDGKSITLEGDAPPTEQELEQIFSHIGGGEDKPAQPNDLLSQVGRDATQFGYGFANEALLNVPDLATSKIPALKGLNPGEPTDVSENINRMAGSTLGFITGLPEKIGAKAVSTIGKPVVEGIGKMVGKRFAKGAVSAGVGSLASSPFRAMKEGKDYSPSGEAGRTAFAMGAGGIGANVAARFSRGGRYLAAKGNLGKAEGKLSKLTSELTQVGDKEASTIVGKEIKPAKKYAELNKQIEGTKREIFDARDAMIKSRNQRIKSDEYIKPFYDWINKMDSTPEFQGRMEPVKEYFNKRMAYHVKNGMDLVGMEDMKEGLQKLTQSLLNSSAPTEAQAVMKQGLNELRSISKGVMEKYIPEIKAINAKYEPLVDAAEGTVTMAENIQKGVKYTPRQQAQSMVSKLPWMGKFKPKLTESGTLARELERRLPRYTKEIASQAGKAEKAQSAMSKIRPSQEPRLGDTSWTGAVRPRGPRPSSMLLEGPEKPGIFIEGPTPLPPSRRLPMDQPNAFTEFDEPLASSINRDLVNQMKQNPRSPGMMEQRFPDQHSQSIDELENELREALKARLKRG